MVEHDRQEDTISRFGWFSAGALTMLAAFILFFLASNLFHSYEVEVDTPHTIIEAR